MLHRSQKPQKLLSNTQLLRALALPHGANTGLSVLG
jgi:hypothetical protein